MEDTNSKQQFLLGLFGGIAIVSVIGLIIMAVVMVKADDNFGEIAGQQTAGQTKTTGDNKTVFIKASAPGVTTFFEKPDAEICKENGLPVVYLFSTTWCSHCAWINNTFNETIKKYVDAGKIKAYHWEIDINDNVLTTEKETVVPVDHLAVYQEFNPDGSIPTFVFGCKYGRIGNGYERQDDLDSEMAEFEALIEEITK